MNGLNDAFNYAEVWLSMLVFGACVRNQINNGSKYQFFFQSSTVLSIFFGGGGTSEGGCRLPSHNIIKSNARVFQKTIRSNFQIASWDSWIYP